MSDKENLPLQIDATLIEASKSDQNSIIEIDPNAVQNLNLNHLNSVINNNLLVTNQNNATTNFTFESCNGITLGNIVNINPGWSPGSSQNSSIADMSQDTEINLVYKKTPTIKAMMLSEDPLDEQFLDIFCANFGAGWKSLTVHLQINELFVQRMYEDHFQFGGTQEVSSH
jgi:hypothetical protein